MPGSVLFAVISDAVIISMVSGVISLLGVAITGYLAFKTAQLNVNQKATAVKVDEATVKVDQAAAKADVAAVKVDQVKQVLETSNAAAEKRIDDVVRTGEKILVHVNSSTGASLQSLAVALRQVANLTDASVRPTAEAAAALAEANYADHMRGQSKIDIGDKIEEAVTKTMDRKIDVAVVPTPTS